MSNNSVVSCAVIAACLFHWSAGHAAENTGAKAPHAHKAETSEHSSCHVPVSITEEAERQPGGALYAGPAVPHHPKQGESMPQMKGAHAVHEPQHGGAFFMAPNKMHHLEGLYSDHCGFQLFFYNAFTKDIGVKRFRAFIKVIPSDEQEPEVIRFLSASEDGTFLKTAIGDEVTRPFEIELYVKFPESDEPQLFNILVPGHGMTAENPPGLIELKIEDHKVQGKKVIRVKKGEVVNLRWTTDEMVSLHLHGYDVEKTVHPGSTATMTFTAHATGRFPITSHGFDEPGGSHQKGHSHGGSHDEATLIYFEVHPR